MRFFVFIIILVFYLWGEFAVFGAVSEALGDFGILWVIVSTIITAAMGMRLFARAGRGAMQRFAEAAAEGRPPVFAIADGWAITLAAGLLLLPGYITDLAGFVLFIPGLRSMLGVMLFALILALLPRGGVHVKTHFGMDMDTHSPAHDPAHDKGGDRGGGEAEDPGNDAPAKMTIEGEFKRKN